MKEKTQSAGTNPLHQPVAGKLKFKVGTKSIAVDFTDQRISAHAGTAAFWGWLHPSGFLSVLEKALPHQMPATNNHLTPLEKAVGFLQGILCEARKLTHVSYLRRDPLMPELLGVRRVPSQSTLSRFFQAFDGVAANATCFRVLWNWTMKRVPSHRGRVVTGRCVLQPHCALPTRLGMADQSDHPVPAILDFCYRRTLVSG
jgi:hypothetical protein